ncbi:MAG TPA: GNAT family N-acetyltransferase [Ruminococcus flavefaciens]|nr:GNAT family N-acetyltransferase [Ruminococcus flavefaciens]HQM01322.1 GNAT family N-acetyltransferase [Ruminococcus flavefaciens]
MDRNFIITEYDQKLEFRLFAFLEKCLPESGRALDLNGRHSFYKDIHGHFDVFLCMKDGETIIGTVAVRLMNDKDCELKSLYLLEKYRGLGLGRKLLETAVRYAADIGYERMYLDSLSTSKRALKLYRMAGFTDTEKYNDSIFSDVFMVLELRR